VFSYVHRYHAGGFADVHKHLILIALLQALHQKPTPFGVLDLYAGEGQYDLLSEESQKNAEYKQGIGLLLDLPQPPLLLQTLLQMMNGMQYPGSPKIIADFLRTQDHAIAIEHHPQAITMLRNHLGHHPRMTIHDRDALEALRALVPFKQKRGLVFIDPSYEVKTEYTQIAEAVIKTAQHFSHGIYAIWYPILPAKNHLQLLRKIKNAKLNTWQCEWFPSQERKEGILGSGMIIINLPWKTDEIIINAFSRLPGNFYCQFL